MPQNTNPGSTIERHVYFYRIVAGSDGGGKPLRFDPEPALRHLDSLAFVLDGSPTPGRYMVASDGEATCCWIDRYAPPPRIRIAHIRHTNFPQLEQAGNLTPLVVPPASGLAEQIHVLFFPDNIIGSEYNYHGPRVSRLAHYLSDKAKGVCSTITIEPLLRPDVTAQIDRLQDIRLLRLNIRAPYVHTIAQADRSLSDAFCAALSLGNLKQVEIVLRPDTKGQHGVVGNALDLVKRLLKLDGLKEGAVAFEVKGVDSATGRVSVVDVLKDQLVSKKQIILANSQTRALDSASAYEAIEAAYGELHDQIKIAAGIGK